MAAPPVTTDPDRPKPQRSRLLRGLMLVGLLVLLGGAGLLTGRAVRNLREHGSLLGPGAAPQVGDALPEIAVIADGSHSALLGDLIGERGAVLLVLDPECPPCIDLAMQWQQAIDRGAIDHERVLAIATGTAEAAGFAAARHGLMLRLAIDRDSAAARRLGITAFPYQAMIDGTGHIRSVSNGSGTTADPDLAQLILGF